MTENRHEIAKQHLVELLRLYKNQNVVVKKSLKGEPIVVTSKTFVKKQMEVVGMNFPFEEILMPSNHIKNKSLDTKGLTIIFHEAVLEYEASFLEQLKYNPQLDSYVYEVLTKIDNRRSWLRNLYPDYDLSSLSPFGSTEETDITILSAAEEVRTRLELLQSIGVVKIVNKSDVDLVLWNLSMRGLQLDKYMCQALVVISTNPDMVETITRIAKPLFNNLIQKCQRDSNFLAYGKRAELDRQIEALKEENKKVKRKLEEQKVKERVNKKTAEKLFKQLRNSESKFFQRYDFELEEDRLEFISWFEMGGRKIKNSLIRKMQGSWRFSEEAWKEMEVLINGVNEKYAALHENDLEDSDE